MIRARRWLAVALAAWAASQAWAHDSWLIPAGRPGAPALELTTGIRYPAPHFNPGADSLLARGCVDATGAPLALQPGRDLPDRLELKVPVGTRPASCWIEMRSYDVEIEPPIVELYLNEIRASAAVRADWAAMLARGVSWHESYRKFARIELAGASATAGSRRPAGLALELVVLGSEPLVVGRPVELQLLRDGQPLAGFPLELLGERSAIGIWRETDAQGRLRLVLPFAGRWMLRGTDLRLARQQRDHWESRFVTLAIDVPDATAPGTR